jgi:hypothetical protein
MPQTNRSNVYEKNYENKCWKDIYYAGVALFAFKKADYYEGLLQSLA